MASSPLDEGDVSMKRIILCTIAAAALFTATTAFAADVIGAIKAIDAEAHTLILDNGETYMLPMKADLSKLKVGDMVKVTYTTKDGKNEVTAIAIGS